MSCITSKRGKRNTARHHPRETSTLEPAAPNRHTDSPHTASAERRHTFANDWLSGGGSEGDLMRLMGWHDRSMVDRYAADMQEQRAFEAKHQRGDMY